MKLAEFPAQVITCPPLSPLLSVPVLLSDHIILFRSNIGIPLKIPKKLVQIAKFPSLTQTPENGEKHRKITNISPKMPFCVIFRQVFPIVRGGAREGMLQFSPTFRDCHVGVFPGPAKESAVPLKRFETQLAEPSLDLPFFLILIRSPRLSVGCAIFFF